MLRITGIIAFVLFLIAPAEARQRHAATGLHPMCNITMPCEMPYASTLRQARVARGKYVARQMGFGAPRHSSQRVTPRVAVREVKRERPSGVSLAGVVPQLASKVVEIIGTCGSQVISAVRHTFIAGTRHISQHANGTAVDVTGNPSCIYSMLHDWPGGYSVDYAAVRHVHISLGGPERGLRFVHGGYRHRYAHNHHHRYASR
jgi:hypothetical protein